MNRLRAWIMSIRILDGPNYRVIQSTNGVYLAIEPKKSKSTGGGDARWS